MKLSDNPLEVSSVLAAIRCDGEELDIHSHEGRLEIYKCTKCDGVHIVLHSKDSLAATVVSDADAMKVVEMLHVAAGTKQTVQ